MKQARLRMIATVHKFPFRMRPIVCCAGSIMNAWRKLSDYRLQKLKPSVPTTVKDSQQVLDKTASLTLPPGAKLFAADANSMYNNVDTDHAIKLITWWLRDLHTKNELLENFPLDAVLSAIVAIMQNNIFVCGNVCFLQLLATAMGTSSVVMRATPALYYA